MQSLSLRNLTLAATLSFAALSTPASAQSVSADVMSRCAKVVSGIKFEGQPAERNRDMMNLACLSNGGSIPGGAQEQPVSLKGRQPARR